MTLPELLPDVHTHDKGHGVLYQTREPAGTADRYKHERDVALKVLHMIAERDDRISVDELLKIAENALQ